MWLAIASDSNQIQIIGDNLIEYKFHFWFNRKLKLRAESVYSLNKMDSMNQKRKKKRFQSIWKKKSILCSYFTSVKSDACDDK